MSRAADIAAKLGDQPLAVCQHLLPNGRQLGHEYECGDLGGAEGRSLKVHLNGKGSVWSDFATGEAGGDLLDLWASVRCGGDKSQAMREAADYLGMDATSTTGKRQPQRKAKANGDARKSTNAAAAAVSPVPTDAPDPPAEHPKLGAPALVFDYHDDAGELLFQVWRFEPKDFRPLSLWRVGDHLEWRWQAVPSPRPLYGLADLVARPDAPVLLTEGEKSADIGRELFLDHVVMTWPGGSNAVGEIDWSPLARRRVVIMPDADTPGIKAGRKVADELIAIGATEVRLAAPLDDLGNGANLDNIENDDHLVYAKRLIDQAKDRRTGRLDEIGIVAATDLMATKFPPIKWIAKPYLTEGLALLCGKPKIGKSWLALGLATAVAAGKPALGNVETTAGDVLVMTLEDNKRRLQKRMRAVLQGAPVPARLELVTEWRRLDDGGLDDIKLWIELHPDARLIVIDTLAKVRAKRRANASIYDEDYQAVSGLKKLADDHGIAIMLVHHLRKSTADDPLDEVSGSTGLTGAVDTILILKRDRAQADAVLMATGRDIQEIESAMQFDTDTGHWTVLGDADEYRRSQEQIAIIHTIDDAGEPKTPKELAAILGKKDGAVRFLLKKMTDNGLLTRRPDGRYEIIR